MQYLAKRYLLLSGIFHENRALRFCLLGARPAADSEVGRRPPLERREVHSSHSLTRNMVHHCNIIDAVRNSSPFIGFTSVRVSYLSLLLFAAATNSRHSFIRLHPILIERLPRCLVLPSPSRFSSEVPSQKLLVRKTTGPTRVQPGVYRSLIMLDFCASNTNTLSLALRDFSRIQDNCDSLG